MAPTQRNLSDIKHQLIQHKKFTDNELVENLKSGIIQSYVDACDLLQNQLDNSNSVTQTDSKLGLAVRYHQIEVVRELLAVGVSPDETIPGNNTPLFRAAYNGDIEIVKLLVAHGANVHIINQFGQTALSVAMQEQKEDVVEYLSEILKENTVTVQSNLVQDKARYRYFIPENADGIDNSFIQYKKLPNMTLIGKSKFAEVFLAATDKHQIIAVKKINVNFSKKIEYQWKIDVINLKHSHVVRFLRIIDRRQLNGTFQILMEFIPGQTLFNLLTSMENKLSEDKVWSYLSQITSGLKYLHGKGIYHKDLKSANIMVHGNKEQLKLIDFGVAQTVQQEEEETLVGTIWWMAPELFLSGKPEYTETTDLYALGGTLYEMVTCGDPPRVKEADDSIEQCIPMDGSIVMTHLYSYLLTNHTWAPSSIPTSYSYQLQDLYCQLTDPCAETRTGCFQKYILLTQRIKECSCIEIPTCSSSNNHRI